MSRYQELIFPQSNFQELADQEVIVQEMVETDQEDRESTHETYSNKKKSSMTETE